MSLSRPAAQRISPLFSAALVLLTLFYLTNTPLFAQQYTDNKADQVLRGSGRVNPSTLGMEFDLPIASYPGRGVNVPVSLSYSSKVWRLQYNYTSGQVNAPGCDTLNQPVYSENTASGWTSSLGFPYIEYTGKDNMFNSSGVPLDDADPPCTTNSTGYMNAYIKRLTLHLPSGETHELRAGDSPVLYSPSSSCPNSPCDPGQVNLQANWDTTYYAVDGSNVKYIEDSTTNTYRVLMPDGSHYDLSLTTAGLGEALIRKASTFTDRNGNYTTYHDPDATYPNGYWTDTLGRNIPVPLKPSAPTTAGDQTYQIPGFGGGTITYTLHWKKLKGTTAADSGLTDFNQTLNYYGDRYWAGTNWAVASPALFHSGNHHTQSSIINDLSMKVNTFNPIVLTAIDLPNGQSYKFSYNIYGEIERIDYPTGGEEQFVYASYPTVSFQYSFYQQANRGVSDRKVYETPGQGTPYEWTYGIDTTGGVYKVNTTNPDSTRTERYLTKGTAGPPVCYPDPSQCVSGNFGYDNGLTGMAYDERAYNSLNQLVSKKLTTWAKTANAVAYSYATADWHPRVTQEENIIYDTLGNGISTTTKYEYEGNLTQTTTPVLQNKVSQYAFVTVGSPLPSTPIKSSELTYLINDPNYSAVVGNYTAQNRVGLVTVSSVKDSAGNIVSQVQTVYDESGYSPGYRGNPTTVMIWDSTKGAVTNAASFISTHTRFDTYGNQYQATDALGNTTTTTFDATYQAFPVTVTTTVPDPTGTNGSNAAFTSSTTYDYTTGLPLTTTDANGQTTTMEYNDPLLRPTKVTAPNGQQTITEYGAGTSSTTKYIKVSTQIDATNWKIGYSWYDGLGRIYRSQEVNSNSDIFVDKQFDAQGRVSRVSNPYRTGETLQWTTNVYDEASRVKEVDLPDGATVKTDYGVSTSGIFGVTKQITDQAGKKRKGISDALGNMVRVIEDPDGQNLSTDYTFDVLGNLRKTVQGEQNRYFMHDSLGHLLYAKQVEQDANANFSGSSFTDPVTGNNQWSVKYVYDDNGNLISTTDARNVTVSATYDHFNRIIFRDYSDATPDVSFYYDGTGLGGVPAYSKGKTTRVSSSVSDTRYTSFDSMGRLLTHQQITGGTTYNTGYTYNLSGALIEETYPSGRKVRNTIDTNGDLSLVETQPTGSSYATRASNFTRNSAGAITKMQLGNGRWETAAYNNRQQITQIGLGTTSTSQDLLKLDYDYGTSTQNNGSLSQQTITVPTVGANTGFTATQTYNYDSLNRLQDATETISGMQTWKQAFTYDRYGNRTFNAANTTTITGCGSSICNPTISTSNNRFSTGQGYSYDANGAVTQDAAGQRFGYDAEGRQTQFFSANNSTQTPDTTYSFDGDGKRVKKVSATENTTFVYDASGQLVEEYSGGTLQTAYVYAGSTLLTTETSSGTNYLTADHLGSPRIVTDASGNVTSRKDYTAFGEETVTSQRTTGLGYNPQNIRQDYTGYQKDNESGLEYAQARYYNPLHGRFTSVDPLTASAEIRNPQTFNRYSYGLNSPYKFTDPLGLKWYERIDPDDSHRTQYMWSESEPIDGGWHEVDFGVSFSNRYLRLDGAMQGTTPLGTIYLDKDNDKPLNPEQYYNNRYGPSGCADSYHCTGISPGFDAKSAGEGWAGMFGAAYNVPAGTYNIGAYGVNYFSGSERLPYAWEYTPTTDGEKFSYYGTNTLLLVEGGASLFKSIRSFGSLPEAASDASKIKYIGRMEDLQSIPREQTFLDQLPDLGSPKANYYQNMSVIRKGIRDGYTIRDASFFRPDSQLAGTPLWPGRTIRQTFLGAERNLLRNRGIMK